MNWTLIGMGALTWALAGCSPALNWRAVPVPAAAVTVTLPCKPDHAERTVELAGTPVSLAMLGCEADGAMLAFSHAELADASQVGAALTHWRAAVLAHLGPGAAASAVDTPYAPTGVLPLPQSVRSVIQGQRSDGTGVSAQAWWFARTVGSHLRVYHAVVYTPQPRPELADTFFNGLEFQQ